MLIKLCCQENINGQNSTKTRRPVLFIYLVIYVPYVAAVFYCGASQWQSSHSADGAIKEKIIFGRIEPNK